ncbi:MAG: helix-turn-helix transcriptional regulator [Spirochaetes bacterium]|nr:helix-turn-helix transcriptional regulator [Spirochaetota bacterium]
MSFFFRGGKEEPRSSMNPWPLLKYPWVHIEIPVGGEWDVTIHDATLRVHDGEMLIIKPGVMHRLRKATDGTMTTLYALMSWMRRGSDVITSYRFPSVLPEETGMKVLPILRKLIANAQQQGLAFSAREQELGFTLLEVLSVHASADDESSDEPRIASALDHIDMYWNTTIRRETLAQMTGLSPSRFHSVFQKATGFAPLEYITAIRLQHACDMLASTKRSIGDIASACGFTSVYYFSRCFSSHKKITPSAYREGQREE